MTPLLDRPRALLLLVVSLLSGPALAHPHVWLTARAELVFGADGKVAAVRHRWTFDEAYSSFAVQGLDTNGDGKTSPDELKELATFSTGSLAEFGYFTSLKSNGAKQPLEPPRGEAMTFEGGRLTLQFELPLKAAAASRVLILEVYDPTFFVEFKAADDPDAVKLQGAPAGCAVTVTRPKPAAAAPADPKALSESFFQSLTATSSFGSQFANRAVVACP